MLLSSPLPSIRKRDWLRARLPLIILVILLMLFVTTAAVAVWYVTRPQPAPIVREQLFPGIWYTREIRKTPVAQVIHILEIDLKTPGLRFRVTPRDNRTDYTYSAQTVSEFLVEEGMSLAINGDYFAPSHDVYITSVASLWF